MSLIYFTVTYTFSSCSSSSFVSSSSEGCASSAGGSVVVVVVVEAPGLVLPRAPILGPGLKGLIAGLPIRGRALAVVDETSGDVSSLCDSSSAADEGACVVVVLLLPLIFKLGLCRNDGLVAGAEVLGLVSAGSSEGAAVVLPRPLDEKRLPLVG